MRSKPGQADGRVAIEGGVAGGWFKRSPNTKGAATKPTRFCNSRTSAICGGAYTHPTDRQGIGTPRPMMALATSVVGRSPGCQVNIVVRPSRLPSDTYAHRLADYSCGGSHG